MLYRDDTYLVDSLEHLAYLHTEHVRKGIEPPEELHWHNAAKYSQLLTRTVQLASQAKLVLRTEENIVHEEAESNAFW